MKMTTCIRGKSHTDKMFLKTETLLRFVREKTLLIKMGRFSLKISNHIFNRSFLIKMNIEEIKFKKNKVTPMCCTFFFLLKFLYLLSKDWRIWKN